VISEILLLAGIVLLGFGVGFLLGTELERRFGGPPRYER
jgi:hypothetical protein